jgi:hypothetical protein
VVVANEELGVPLLITVLRKPHLLPMALVFTADLNRLTEWIV